MSKSAYNLVALTTQIAIKIFTLQPYWATFIPNNNIIFQQVQMSTAGDNKQKHITTVVLVS